MKRKKHNVAAHVVVDSSGKEQILLVLMGRAYYFTIDNAYELGEALVRQCQHVRQKEGKFALSWPDGTLV